jgi:hypothetical protein
MFFTFIVVVAIAAFIPYVAAPGIVNGVKAIDSPPAATSFDAAPAPAADRETAEPRVPQTGDSQNAG